MLAEIRKRKRRWIGHILRHENMLRTVLEGRMKGKRPRGRKRIKMVDDIMTGIQGRSQTFSFGGATGGASFATRGAVNGLCRTSMQWHGVTRKIFGGPLEGPGKMLGGSGSPGTPLAPPLLALMHK